MLGKSTLVIFDKELPNKRKIWWQQFEVVIAPIQLKSKVVNHSLTFVDIGDFVEAGSIYEASVLLEELSNLKIANGSRLAKSALYHDYELWWIHYDGLFRYFCLPYTQYKKLLEYLRNFQEVCLYQPPFKSLFTCYFQTYRVTVRIFNKKGFKNFTFLPVGVFLQIFLTTLSLPALIIKKLPVMVFTGDKFEKDKDYDFRMKFIYEELRNRKISFVEFVRSLEPWEKVLRHAFLRKRPVIYPEAITFVGRLISFVSGGRGRAYREFGSQLFTDREDLETKFKLLIATQYLLSFYDDIWAIRITKVILRVIGVRAVFIAAAVERNFHAVLGCKLNKIPTVGILHGTASRYYNGYEFLPSFDGEKSLSVDKYGVWSEWWKDHFLIHGRAYKAEQIAVSGPMRPIVPLLGNVSASLKEPKSILRVLLISEELAAPREVLPYFYELLKQQDLDLTIKFRPYRDGFEDWLLKNEPNILKSHNLKIIKSSMQEAIKDCDVAVGSYSTAVLEAFIQLKTPIFFRTRKWGDYYDLKEHDEKHSFFAEDPQELIAKVKNARFVSLGILKDLREKYFGDPSRNGSKWVVDQIEKNLKNSKEHCSF